MTTQELLDLDYSKEENKELIQKALRKIKPLSKYEMDVEIPLLTLEILVGKYARKYCLMVNYLTPTFIPGERNAYCASIKRTDTLKYLENVYGTTLYEVFAKLCIKFYYEVEKKNVPVQDWEEVKKRRSDRLKELLGK